MAPGPRSSSRKRAEVATPWWEGAASAQQLSATVNKFGVGLSTSSKLRSAQPRPAANGRGTSADLGLHCAC